MKFPIALATLLLLDGAGAHAEPPSFEEISNTTFHGIDETTITLVDGRWEGEPFVPDGASRPTAGLVEDFLQTGDLDRDGNDDSVVLLWSNMGGSGTFNYIAAVGRRESNVAVLAVADLGDRVQVRKAEVEADGRIVLETVQAGADDAACCPGARFHRVWQLVDGKLVEVETEERGRISSADLAGTKWVLTQFAPDAPVMRGVEVTLIIAGDRVRGSGGCNRYNGGIADLETPGSIRVGPIAGTRKACQGPSMSIESRYLTALGRVKQFSFSAGQLVLTWMKDDEFGNLRFRAEPIDR
jgi:heat shock protein HslJ